MEFKITDYGASPSNPDTANDAALASALAAASAAGGGRVVQPSGRYQVSQGWVGTGSQWSNIELVGEGDATQLVSTSPTNNVISVNGTLAAPAYNFQAHDFVITSLVQKTGGAGMYASYAARSYVHDLKADPVEETNYYLFDALRFDRFDDIEVEDIVCSARQHGLILNGSKDGSWGADCFAHGGKITSDATTAGFTPGQIGVRLAGGCGGIVLDDLDIVYNDNGLVMDQSAVAVPNREVFVKSGVFIDSNGSDGLQVAANSVGTLMLTGTWVASNGIRTGGYPGGNGVNIGYPQAPTTEIVVTGARIFNNKGTGFAISGGDLTMAGANVTDNGQDTAKGGDGIGIYNGAVNFSVDAHCVRNGLGGPSTRGNGLYIPAGAQYFAVFGRYWANGHRNIYDNSGAVQKLISAIS